MEWQILLLLFFGSVLILMAAGMPVAFSFLTANVVFMYLYWGGSAGLGQLLESLFAAVGSFTLLPIPLFLLMGEVMFRSGIAPHMMDVLDKWLGRLPGRLGLLAVGGGTIFATLSGASMASVAMLGSVLVPEMERRGYKKPMSLGPILGSGGLAIMIPPSGLAVLLGAVAEISVGRILIAIIVPGILMAVLYATYIILRCQLQPSIAPAYEVVTASWSERLLGILRYVLPLGFIFFLVVGLIFLGIATPSEAAATGALGTFILAAVYKRLNWTLVKESIMSTVRVTVMVFMIIAGATAFSQIVAFSGASRALVNFTLGLPFEPLFIVGAVLVVSLFLGMFINLAAILMLTIPLFVPVIIALGFDPIWFAVIFLLTLEMGATSPPFGLALFVMKGVAPPGTTMGDCYKAALPFLGCDLIVLLALLFYEPLVLWLPHLMRSI
ncbi:MAG: TRAP transporter large permease subunit [Chloroflexi bacterium]|nr:TRAP transporter large permease subunit [Chloroflexota bacterium]